MFLSFPVCFQTTIVPYLSIPEVTDHLLVVLSARNLGSGLGPLKPSSHTVIADLLFAVKCRMYLLVTNSSEIDIEDTYIFYDV